MDNLMKLKNISLFLFLTALLLLPISAQQNKGILKNADVVLMSQKGLGDDVIIKAIETSEANFATSTAALIQLHDSKVSDNIIKAMQDAQARRGRTDSLQSLQCLLLKGVLD